MQKLILLLVAVSALLSCIHAFRFPIEQQNQDDLYQQYEMPLVKRNRLCLLNAGLSQGCDLSDIIMAKQQASKFMSFAGPGRK